MGKHGCAVNCCQPSKDHSRHRFPNPIKDSKLFNKWLQCCANDKLRALPSDIVYQNARVCQKHFQLEDFESNNVLQKSTYPSLFLPTALPQLPYECSTSEIQRRLQILKEHSYYNLSSVDNTVCESFLLLQQTRADLETNQVNTDVEIVPANTDVDMVKFDLSIANVKTRIHEDPVKSPSKRLKASFSYAVSVCDPPSKADKPENNVALSKTSDYAAWTDHQTKLLENCSRNTCAYEKEPEILRIRHSIIPACTLESSMTVEQNDKEREGSSRSNVSTPKIIVTRRRRGNSSVLKELQELRKAIFERTKEKKETRKKMIEQRQEIIKQHQEIIEQLKIKNLLLQKFLEKNN